MRRNVLAGVLADPTPADRDECSVCHRALAREAYKIAHRPAVHARVVRLERAQTRAIPNQRLQCIVRQLTCVRDDEVFEGMPRLRRCVWSSASRLGRCGKRWRVRGEGGEDGVGDVRRVFEVDAPDVWRRLEQAH